MFNLTDVQAAFTKHATGIGLNTSPMFAKGQYAFGECMAPLELVSETLRVASRVGFGLDALREYDNRSVIAQFDYTDRRCEPEEEYTQADIGKLIVNPDGNWLATGAIAAIVAHRLPACVATVNGWYRTRSGWADHQPQIPQSEEL